MTDSFYNACYTILVDHLRAAEADRHWFVQVFANNPNTFEWRFCGILGFGGKFWRNDGRHYVTYYREDHTPKLDQVLDRVNALIEALPGPVV